jgi:peptidoglycan L-alanyl-D-glutamate endopeptidase CwlK
MNLESVLAGLLPELAALARLHLGRCSARGITVALTSGWRSPMEQIALYAKGRARTPTGWVVTDQRVIVTNALPDKAPHCRGAAYDICPIVAERAAWDRLDLFQAVADAAPPGLVWGGSWPRFKDLPHYELPSWRSLPLKEK